MIRNILSEQTTSREPMMKLFHYSKQEAESITLSPDRFGASSFTRNDVRSSDYPRVFFYTNVAEKERFFMRGYKLYKTEVKRSDVYNINTDPEGLVKMIKDQNQGVLVIDKLLKKVHQEQGHKGMSYGGSNRTIVVWFEPIEVFPADEKSELEEEGFDIGLNNFITPQQVRMIFDTFQVSILSAERGDNTEKVNNLNTNRLLADLNAKAIENGWYLTEATGGFVETTETGERRPVDGEKSFMVWAKLSDESFEADMISLGNKYDQDSILMVRPNSNAYFVSTSERTGGSIQELGRFSPYRGGDYFTTVNGFKFSF